MARITNTDGTTSQLWTGLAEVRPASAGQDFPSDAAGAFVAVAGRASSHDQFQVRVAGACSAVDLELLELSEVHPVQSLSEIETALLSELDRDPSAIGFGTFHTYPPDS